MSSDRSASKLLQFDNNGYLFDGTVQLTVDQFLEHFCASEAAIDADTLAPRSSFFSQFKELYTWASDKGACSILVGGSFVTTKSLPNDLDAVVLFKTSDVVPDAYHGEYGSDARLDLQLLSEDYDDLLTAFLQLLALDRRHVRHGIIQIKLHDSVRDITVPLEESPLFATVARAYGGRKIVRPSGAKGTVVSIHGIRTHATWMSELSLATTSRGWAFAPFIYGNQSALILRSANKRTSLVEDFRRWIERIVASDKRPLSVVAHSLGTYILGRYLVESKDLGHRFDGIVLCGSILTESYDWTAQLGTRVGNVLNIVAPNDRAVSKLSPLARVFLGSDPLYGRAGVRRFSDDHPRLRQSTSGLLNHSNQLEPDLIRSICLPFLTLSLGSSSAAEYEGAWE
jgi:hypothetical protein